MKVTLPDGTGTRVYRHVIVDVDRHGRARVYFRRQGKNRGPKIRLYALPGSLEFDEEYRRAFFTGQRSGPIAPAAATPDEIVPGSVRWLCLQYYSSARFQSELDQATRRRRRTILDEFCIQAGNRSYKTLPPDAIARWRDEKASAGLPQAGNDRVKALRAVYGWACLGEVKLASYNPARDVGFLRSLNPNGFRSWDEEHVAKFEAHFPLGSKARLALDLLLYTGARISDVVQLGPQMEREGGIILHFTEAKGRRHVVKEHDMPILPPLRASIDATRIGHLVYLATEYGHPYSEKGFGNWFKRCILKSGLPSDLSAHGLRKCGARRAAEAGASDQFLMAHFGWSTAKQAAHYTRAASRKKMQALAAAFLLPRPPADRTKNEEVPPLRVVPPSGTYRSEK